MEFWKAIFFLIVCLSRHSNVKLYTKGTTLWKWSIWQASWLMVCAWNVNLPYVPGGSLSLEDDLDWRRTDRSNGFIRENRTISSAKALNRSSWIENQMAFNESANDSLFELAWSSIDSSFTHVVYLIQLWNYCPSIEGMRPLRNDYR